MGMHPERCFRATHTVTRLATSAILCAAALIPVTAASQITTQQPAASPAPPRSPRVVGQPSRPRPIHRPFVESGGKHPKPRFEVLFARLNEVAPLSGDDSTRHDGLI